MKRSFWLLITLWPLVGLADEADLAELLGRIRHNGSAEFNYQETRKLELAVNPWHGQGMMLSGADGSLIKLQLQPKRVIMVSTPQRLYYWDPQQKQRHSAAVGQAGAAGAQIGLFRSVLQGHAADLQASYDFVPQLHDKTWRLWIAPKPGLNSEDAPTIEISGDENADKRQVIISQPDGEATEYQMLKVAEGPEVDKSIRQLLLEALGD
jgi:hypothetical protein